MERSSTPQREPLFKGRSGPVEMSARYRLFRRTMILLGRFFLGFEFHGAQHVPKEGPLVVAANHHRFFDPVFVCMAVPRRLQWMAKKELFAPPLHRFFYFIGSFPVDREGGGRAAIRDALKFLAAGWALGIFPEGTRQRDHASGEAKSGAVMLAIRGNAPVLPVFVGRIPGPVARLRGEKFSTYVGRPINIDNTIRGGRAYREAADDILRSIYALPEERGSGG
ncbi:MAG TPA: lysophospholipid acyltransferase family protein [Rubrobacteraceae bacterium]|nr:lysophospholipid acyltransferase family protein [Rubrobacteraceae bacterium]